MKFICLGYVDETKLNALPAAERDALLDACLAHDEVLTAEGHFVGGEGLDSARNAVTLRYRDGKVVATDGPFTETKEQIGGFMVLEARDRAHVIELLSRHPGMRFGPWEVRAVEDMTPLVEASAARRRG